jgi:TetR/AcrR family transcriptional repressor of nem operon
VARPSKREEIVEAALDQFHTHGFNATGVKDITDAAGVPKGSFYNHFESKEALAQTVLARYGDSRRIPDLADRSVEPVARLRAHFGFLRGEFEQLGLTRGCLFGNFGAEVADHSEPLRASVHSSFRTWADAVAGALAEAREAGAVRADLDPEGTARFLLGAWEGALVAARAERGAAALDAFFAVTFDALLTHP